MTFASHCSKLIEMRKIVATSLVFLFCLILISLAQPSTIKASWFVDANGYLTYRFDGNVLGETDERKEDNSGKREDRKVEEGKVGERKVEENKDRQEKKETITINQATGVITKTKMTEGGESKTEIKFVNGDKIKTETKLNELKSEVYSGGQKIKLERKDGRLMIKSKTEGGEDLELGEEQEFSIKERLDKNEIKVSTGSGEAMVFARNNVAARTNFPLSVDLATNELIVTTPNGSKTVTVLPDQAIQNLLAVGIIDRIGGIGENVATEEIQGVTDLVTLTERNGEPVYEIAGVSDQKLLGFIPVEITQTVAVSAETGSTIATDKSFTATLLDLLSL